MIKRMLYFFLVLNLAQVSSMAEGEEKRKIAIPEFFTKNKTTIKKPFELRDPFKRKRLRVGRQKSRIGYLEGNSFSNLASIEGYKLEEIRIVGILIGKERRALAKVLNPQGQPSKDTYVLTEGMKLGENDAEIRAIVPGGIVLVEKLRNVYNQDEYIETVIPVTNEAD